MLLFLFPLLVSAKIGPKPEKIYSITKIVYPIAYYHEQAGLWKMEIKKDQKNEEAWSNYYFACRMANILSAGAKTYDLEQIVANIGKTIPNSYAHHYIAYAHGGFNPDNFHHLQKAYDMEPENPASYESMLAYHEVMGDKEKSQFFAEKTLKARKHSPAILNWNYNVLMSIEPQAILVTYGDNDTYPLWLLQKVKGLRPDVKVFNIHLLNVEKYRDRLFEENKIPLLADPKDRALSHDEIMQHLFQQANAPIYLGIAFSRQIREKYSAQLYLTGLALKYSVQEFDNLKVVKKNVNERFLLDYLKVDLYEDFSASVVDQINANYIPAFILLYKHYREKEMEAKAKDMERLLQKIASAAGMEDKIKTYFE